MRYDHVQRAPLFLLVLLPGLAGLAVAGLSGERDAVRVVLLVTGALMVALAFCVVWLAVRDDGEALVVRFGPLPVFRMRVPIARIRAVERDRSRLLDGWGIHWSPDRGWIWNLWGRDCVALVLDRGRLRIGTDDPEGLLEHLRARLAERAS